MRKKVLWAAALVLLIAVFYVIYLGWIKHDMSDFGVPYRNAQRVMRGETPYRPSDGHLQFKYAPVSALFYAPLAILPVGTAKVVWYYLEIGLLAAVLWFGTRMLPEKRKGPVFVVGLTLLTMLKFLGREIELGQVNLLIIFFLVLMLAAYLGRKDAWAGSLWAVSILFKPYALVFLPFFLLKKRFKILGVGGAVLLAGLALPAFIYGFPGNITVLREWASTLSSSTPGLVAVGDNASLYAFYWKLFAGASETLILAGWLGTGCVIAGLILWMMRTGTALKLRAPDVLEGFFLMILIPLFSPLGWYYNYLYSLPAVVLLLNAWPRLSRTWKIVLAADLILIGGTIREILGKDLFHLYTRSSLVVVNYLVLLAVLAYVRKRAIA